MMLIPQKAPLEASGPLFSTKHFASTRPASAPPAPLLLQHQQQQIFPQPMERQQLSAVPSHMLQDMEHGAANSSGATHHPPFVFSASASPCSSSPSVLPQSSPLPAGIKLMPSSLWLQPEPGNDGHDTSGLCSFFPPQASLSSRPKQLLLSVSSTASSTSVASPLSSSSCISMDPLSATGRTWPVKTKAAVSTLEHVVSRGQMEDHAQQQEAEAVEEGEEEEVLEDMPLDLCSLLRLPLKERILEGNLKQKKAEVAKRLRRHHQHCRREQQHSTGSQISGHKRLGSEPCSCSGAGISLLGGRGDEEVLNFQSVQLQIPLMTEGFSLKSFSSGRTRGEERVEGRGKREREEESVEGVVVLPFLGEGMKGKGEEEGVSILGKMGGGLHGADVNGSLADSPSFLSAAERKTAAASGSVGESWRRRPRKTRPNSGADAAAVSAVAVPSPAAAAAAAAGGFVAWGMSVDEAKGSSKEAWQRLVFADAPATPSQRVASAAVPPHCSSADTEGVPSDTSNADTCQQAGRDEGVQQEGRERGGAGFMSKKRRLLGRKREEEETGGKSVEKGERGGEEVVQAPRKQRLDLDINEEYRLEEEEEKKDEGKGERGHDHGKVLLKGGVMCREDPGEVEDGESEEGPVSFEEEREEGSSEDDSSGVSNRTSSGGAKVCAHCGTTKTPLWRNGPPGPKSLCNACGIRFNKIRMGKRQPTPAEAAVLSYYSLHPHNSHSSHKQHQRHGSPPSSPSTPSPPPPRPTATGPRSSLKASFAAGKAKMKARNREDEEDGKNGEGCSFKLPSMLLKKGSGLSIGGILNPAGEDEERGQKLKKRRQLNGTRKEERTEPCGMEGEGVLFGGKRKMKGGMSAVVLKAEAELEYDDDGELSDVETGAMLLMALSSSV